MTHPLAALADIIPPQPPPSASPGPWWQSASFYWLILMMLGVVLVVCRVLWRTRPARLALRRLDAMGRDVPVSDRACRAAAILRAAGIEPDGLPPGLRDELDALRYRKDPDPARLDPLLRGMRAHLRRTAWRAR